MCSLTQQEAVELVWQQWHQPDHGISQLIMHAYNVGSVDNMCVCVCVCVRERERERVIE